MKWILPFMICTILFLLGCRPRSNQSYFVVLDDKPEFILENRFNRAPLSSAVLCTEDEVNQVRYTLITSAGDTLLSNFPSAKNHQLISTIKRNLQQLKDRPRLSELVADSNAIYTVHFTTSIDTEEECALRWSLRENHFVPARK